MIFTILDPLLLLKRQPHTDSRKRYFINDFYTLQA